MPDKMINIPVLQKTLQSTTRIVRNNPVVTGAVSTIGSYYVYDQFKKAPEEDKKNSVLRSITVLTGAIIGASLGNKFYNKPEPVDFTSFKKAVKGIANTYMVNLSIPLAGVVTGFFSGELAERLFPPQKPVKNLQEKIEDKVKDKVDDIINTNNDKQSVLARLSYILKNSEKKLEQDFDPGTIGKTFGYGGIGLGSNFDTIFSTLSGFNAGKELGFRNRFKRAISEIIVGVLVPVSVSVPVACVINKITDNPEILKKCKFTAGLTDKLTGFLKTYPKNGATAIKIATLVPIAMVATHLGTKAANAFNQKITERLLQNELWEQIHERETALRKKLVASYHDLAERQTILDSLKSLNIAKGNIHNIKKELVKGKTGAGADS